MAATYTYPGVYVEEIPSGVRSIASVSTSDTAFIDFFRKGPTERAVRITSFADFVRVFGGLDVRSEASYAIKQYYLNGGTVAWVVRVTTGEAEASQITLPTGVVGAIGQIPAYASGASTGYVEDGYAVTTGTITFAAASAGSWGDNLQIAIDHRVPKRKDSTGVEIDDLFNLAVRETELVNGKTRIVQYEAHRNLSLTPGHPRYATDVLQRESALLRVGAIDATGSRPLRTSWDVTDVLAVIGDPTADTDAKRPNGTVIRAPFLRFDGKNLPGDSGVTVQIGVEGKVPNDPADTSWADEDGQHALLGEDDDGNPFDPPRGLNLLERIAPFVFNILCIPATSRLGPDSMKTVIESATKFCRDHRAFYIVDVPNTVATQQAALDWVENTGTLRDNYAALYYPPVEIIDPLQDNRPRRTGISGTMAGVYARTDASRGVWKAPAGTDATLRGVNLMARLTDLENGALNPMGINALRQFPIFGNVSWGARTLDGADMEASEWKYIPVRRTALFIEESLYQGLKWVVFEPNDDRLWAQIRLNVGVFMHGLFRRGAFQGRSKRDAYLVKCDAETTTQADINLGIVNILVGFAPLKPAEFVVLQIQQLAGQLET